MGFFVSRQRYFYSGESVVEIESGGLDCAGADMLGARYPGEAEEYNDPRDAVATALEIAAAWQADEPGVGILVSFGQTSAGMGMEHEGEPVTPETAAAAHEWAERAWEAIPKCDRCGEPGTDWTNEDSLWSDERFCSSYCAEEAFAFSRDDDEEA